MAQQFPMGSTCGGSIIATTKDIPVHIRKNESTGKIEYSTDKGITWIQIGG